MEAEQHADGRYSYNVIHRAGVLLRGITSAFEAETLALEAGLNWLSQAIA